jgi:OmpA-OmpF porin, OOP family
MSPWRTLVGVCVVAVLSAGPAQAQTTDLKGSKDHALITRYPGSVITAYRVIEYDEFNLPLGKVADDKLTKAERLEGKITRIEYAAPLGRSLLELYRNYESALKSGGFQILFSCVDNPECGRGSALMNSAAGPEAWDWAKGQRALSAKLDRPEGNVYVSLHLGQGIYDTRPVPIVLYVVESWPMQSGLVKVDSAAMASDITKAGHSAIYGIYFDTGKAEVKAESDDALKEIAKLLQADTALKLVVVGHTDSVGTLASNMELSRRRAEAVVQALVTKHGVAAARLTAQGVGSLSPVASNRTDEGRAKNRRVELVEQ